jgi:hypothetical protein
MNSCVPPSYGSTSSVERSAKSNGFNDGGSPQQNSRQKLATSKIVSSWQIPAQQTSCYTVPTLSTYSNDPHCLQD